MVKMTAYSQNKLSFSTHRLTESGYAGKDQKARKAWDPCTFACDWGKGRTRI
jgi:hypothetical protein